MQYFSYNDFMDCTENGEIRKVEENIINYEIRNKEEKIMKTRHKIIEILKKKIQIKIFLKEFFNINEIKSLEKINYCNSIKSILDEDQDNNLVCKIKDKEIFIFIKIIETIDTNICYKMFEHSLNIINRWNKEDEIKNRRRPIVIPIVIYIGKETWKSNNERTYNKTNYITYEKNKVRFSYNVININNFKLDELNKMDSEVAKELINIKKEYLYY